MLFVETHCSDEGRTDKFFIIRGKEKSITESEINNDLKPWFPGLMLKTLLNRNLYWNKSNLYIKIGALLKFCYM
jgi:hypothetical protein